MVSVRVLLLFQRRIATHLVHHKYDPKLQTFFLGNLFANLPSNRSYECKTPVWSHPHHFRYRRPDLRRCAVYEPRRWQLPGFDCIWHSGGRFLFYRHWPHTNDTRRRAATGAIKIVQRNDLNFFKTPCVMVGLRQNSDKLKTTTVFWSDYLW